MHVLVTGGTGFVGGHLVPRLIAAGHGVRILARGVHPIDLPPECRLVLGDVASGEGLDEALEGIDAVIHLVAVIREVGSYTFERVNHHGTANLVGAMKQHDVRRLIHMSALGAQPNANLPYAHSKWLGEEVARQSGLDCTIFRPSLIFGSGGGFVARLREAVAPWPIFAPVPGSGRTMFQPIWVEDVVTCLLLALADGARSGQTYELGGPEYLTFDQMVDVVLASLGLRRIKLHIPLAILQPAVAILERLLPNPPITAAELMQLALDNVADLDSVQRHFGFPPAHLASKLKWPVESALRR